MPGRAVLTSPAGTGEISIPEDPNFKWTGLAPVAPFFGSTKNTRVLAFFLGAWALAIVAPATQVTIERSRTEKVLVFIEACLRLNSSRVGGRTIPLAAP